MGRKALDILKDIADHLGWSQPTTIENVDTLEADSRKLLRGLNRVLRAMSAVSDWRFLRKECVLTLEAEYSTGTVDCTNGSATVSGTSTVWVSSMVGKALVVSGHPYVYRITDVDSNTSLTLDKAWIGDTDTDLAYKIVQDRYDLPTDYDRPVDQTWQRFDDSSSAVIYVVDAKTIRERRILRLPYSTDDPEVVGLWPNDSQGEHRQAVFDPFPSTARRVTHDYQMQHPEIVNDTQRILFPQNVEEMIMAGLEYLMLRGPDDDARAQLMLSEFLHQYQSGVARREIGQQRMRLSAAQDRAYQQRSRWRSGGRRIDWKSYFDRADFHDLPK